VRLAVAGGVGEQESLAGGKSIAVSSFASNSLMRSTIIVDCLLAILSGVR
jgi:hypothetical protein